MANLKRIAGHQQEQIRDGLRTGKYTIAGLEGKLRDYDLSFIHDTPKEGEETLWDKNTPAKLLERMWSGTKEDIRSGRILNPTRFGMPFQDQWKDVSEEIRAFEGGLPEGGTVGLIESPEEMYKGAAEVDVPYLGKVHPSRELGRIVGGGVTAMPLRAIGRAALSPGLRMLTDKALNAIGLDPSGKIPRLAQWLATSVGTNVPESFVATSAQALRQGSLEDVEKTALLWMGLGVGSDKLATSAGRLASLIKKWRRDKGKGPTHKTSTLYSKDRASLDPDSEIAQEKENLRLLIEGVDEAEVQSLRFDPKPDDGSPTIIQRALGSEEWSRSVHNPSKIEDFEHHPYKMVNDPEVISTEPIPAPTYKSNFKMSSSEAKAAERLQRDLEIHDQIQADKDALFIPDDPVVMAGGRTFDDVERETRELIASGLPQWGESAASRGLQSSRIAEIVDVPYIGKNLAVRYNPAENQVYVNQETLTEKFKNRVWMRPNIPDVDPLPSNMFKTESAFRDYMIKREVLRTTVLKLPTESKGAYINRLSSLALEDMPTRLINPDPRFRTKGYIIQEELADPKPITFSPDRVDPETGVMFVNPGQREGSAELQKLLNISEVESSMLMSADHNKITEFLKERAEKIGGLQPGLELNKKAYEDAEVVFEVLMRHAPELADLRILGAGPPDPMAGRTRNKYQGIERSALNTTNPNLSASVVKRGELGDIVDELHVRGIDMVRVDRGLPKNMTNAQADEHLRHARRALAKVRTEDQDRILAKLQLEEDTQGLPVTEMLKDYPYHSIYTWDPASSPTTQMDSGWLHYVQSPTGKQSMGRNALAFQGVQHTMDIIEKRLAQKHEWFGTFNKILGTLGYARNETLVSATQQLIKKVRGTDRDILLSPGVGPRDGHGGMIPHDRWRSPSLRWGSPQDLARERAFMLSQILDQPLDKELIKGWDTNEEGKVVPIFRLDKRTGREALANDEVLKQAYEETRMLQREVADALGLDPSLRISDYLAHIFTGRTGALRARVLAGRMGSGAGGDLLRFARSHPDAPEGASKEYKDWLNPVEDLPSEKPWKHLLPRTMNLSGFDYDFEKVMMIYLNGAADKLKDDEIRRYGAWVHSKLPAAGDEAGHKTSIKEQWRDYLKYVLGDVTKGREKFIRILSHKQLFDRATDTLVDWIGMPGDVRAMRILNLPMKDWQKDTREQLIREAGEYLDNLQVTARAINPITGEKLDVKTTDRLRASIALKIDDIRTTLTDPQLQQPVLREIYKIQMISKLGLNVAHGLTNMTQVLVNLWPLLDSGYVTKGMERFLYHKWSDFKYPETGRTPKEVLKESGLLDDTTKEQEFGEVLDPSSMLKRVQEASLIPSKWSEQFNRGVGVLGAYEMFISKALDPRTGKVKYGLPHGRALQAARAISLQANFAFNAAGTPPMLRTPTMRLMFMFASYRLHQTTLTADLMQGAYEGLRREGVNAPEIEKLAKHLMAYGLLLGAGATGFANNNLYERSSHPAVETVSTVGENMGRMQEGVLISALSGPFTDSLLKLMQGNIAKAVAGFAIPTQLQRSWKQGFEFPNNLMDWLKYLGMKKWKGAERPGMWKRES